MVCIAMMTRRPRRFVTASIDVLVGMVVIIAYSSSGSTHEESFVVVGKRHVAPGRWRYELEALMAGSVTVR